MATKKNTFKITSESRAASLESIQKTSATDEHRTTQIKRNKSQENT